MSENDKLPPPEGWGALSKEDAVRKKLEYIRKICEAEALAASKPEHYPHVATLIEAANSAARAGFISGTTNWAAHVQHFLAVKASKPEPFKINPEAGGYVVTECERFSGKPEPQSTMVDKQSTKPEPQAQAAEPDYWHAECDDPDYSAFFPDKADAMARASDHGGTVTPYINHDKFVAAIAKRDAALDACVDAKKKLDAACAYFQKSYSVMSKKEKDAALMAVADAELGMNAAITKAQEARK